jgi:hypothetical protein
VLDDGEWEITVPTKDTVWRYVNLAKLIQMMQSGALWFCRTDLLGDPFEGSLPSGNVEARRQSFETSGKPEGHQMIARANQGTRKQTYVNCWHINEHESAAMWSQYATTDQGIVIRSTVERLFKAASREHSWGYFTMGQVKYLDYADQHRLLGIHTMYKRKSFEHERELRLLLITAAYQPGTEPEGIPIAFDLEMVIEEIRVSPASPLWFRDVVQGTVDRFAECSKVKVTVQKSDMSSGPVF